MTEAMPDIPTRTKLLAKELNRHGFGEWASRLSDAVDYTFTSGEMLMAIRWNLQQFLDIQPTAPAEILSAARQIVDEVNRTGI
jgi:hypothetical protein